MLLHIAESIECFRIFCDCDHVGNSGYVFTNPPTVVSVLYITEALSFTACSAQRYVSALAEYCGNAETLQRMFFSVNIEQFFRTTCTSYSFSFTERKLNSLRFPAKKNLWCHSSKLLGLSSFKRIWESYLKTVFKDRRTKTAEKCEHT